VPHDRVLAAVTHHLDGHPELRWIGLYVSRWLTAPIQQPDGMVVARDRGTPQGSAISPLLANLFMHYAFDRWLSEQHPGVRFERYCDDAVVHCRSYEQTVRVRDAIAARLATFGLRLHPDKTRIVYCKDTKRRGTHEVTSFVFLGFEFRPRRAVGKNGNRFTGFLPAVSPAAIKKIGDQIRSWRLGRRTGSTLRDLARLINPVVAGWVNHYGRFDRSKLTNLLTRLNAHIVRRAGHKYKGLNPPASQETTDRGRSPAADRRGRPDGRRARTHPSFGGTRDLVVDSPQVLVSQSSLGRRGGVAAIWTWAER
jgi:RNA-directed DNA polymerase